MLRKIILVMLSTSNVHITYLAWLPAKPKPQKKNQKNKKKQKIPNKPCTSTRMFKIHRRPIMRTHLSYQLTCDIVHFPKPQVDNENQLPSQAESQMHTYAAFPAALPGNNQTVKSQPFKKMSGFHRILRHVALP